MHPLTPKSLVLDILSSVRGQSVPISALVEAANLFGLGENSLRVTVTRLHTAGRLERAGRGRYRLSGRSLAVDEQVRAWRSGDNRLRAWKQRWLGVHLDAEDAADRSPLSLLGFEPYRPGLYVRPDNWSGGVDRARDELIRLGLPQTALVCALSGLSPADHAAACALWDTGKLEHEYSEAHTALVTSEAQLRSLSEADAMVESFLLGGRVIRQLALDPLLPEELVAAAPRRALTRALRSYDRAGRSAWASFMARHGAPHSQTPKHGASERISLSA